MSARFLGGSLARDAWVVMEDCRIHKLLFQKPRARRRAEEARGVMDARCQGESRVGVWPYSFDRRDRNAVLKTSPTSLEL